MGRVAVAAAGWGVGRRGPVGVAYGTLYVAAIFINAGVFRVECGFLRGCTALACTVHGASKGGVFSEPIVFLGTFQARPVSKSEYGV